MELSHNALVALELLLVVMAVGGALWNPQFGRSRLRAWEKAFATFAHRRGLAIVVSALLPVILRIALLPVLPVPEPAIQEETSYLLAGDTFARGLLANPPHPMAVHLETFQVLQHPTYSSIRPPGQGAFLAVGQVLFQLPWAGVCLSVAFMCGALCWMLQGWLSPGWALLGGLLAGLRLGVFTFWMNSYFGAAVAAGGGMLVLGVLPRIRQHIRFRDIFWMALGIALLYTTRALEGLLMLVPVAGLLLVWLLWDDALPRMIKFRRFVLPMLALLLLFATWITYYNWRVTGQLHMSPYVLGRQRYNTTPPFLFQKPPPIPSYNHELMREYFVNFELSLFREMSTVRGYIAHMKWRAEQFWNFYVRPMLSLPLLIVLPWLWRERRLRLLLAIIVVTISASLVQPWGPPYYFAPLTGIVFLLSLEGLRRLRVWRPHGRAVGLLLARFIPAIAVAMFMTLAGSYLLGFRIAGEEIFGWASADLHAWRGQPLKDRGRVLKQLQSMAGQHLAIVQYAPGYSPHFDWVFNRADIDSAKVVWARDMGPDKNEELLRYFHRRTVWLVQPSKWPWLTLRRLPDPISGM